MPSPTVIRTSMDQIVLAALSEIRTWTGLPPERVFADQRESPPFNAHGDSYIFLRVEDGDFDDGNIIGAGRIDSRAIDVLSVTVRTRLALDEADRDTIWLTEATLGHLILRHAVLNALIIDVLYDADGNWLVTEPLKPTRTRHPKKDKPNTEWGESTLYFEARYELALDQARQ